MRRHHSNDDPDAKLLSPTNNNGGRSPITPVTSYSTTAAAARVLLHSTNDPTWQRNNKKLLKHHPSDHHHHQKHQGKFPTLGRTGVVTVPPHFIKCFSIGGAIFLLAVHGYLFRQFFVVVVPPSSSPPPPLSSISSSASFVLPQHPQQQEELVQGQRRILTPLGPRDREQYTIRINTWQRLDQLLVSIDHHASCPGVAQIQVVWCEPIDPPDALLRLLANNDKLLIERHAVNSLNERFNILPSTKTPTLGILSMDDDVLRPCEAIDSGFFQWTKSPSRFVGFDYRTHVVNEKDGSWKYGYLSTTQKANRYSMSLPRYAFVHRDYLDWYMTDLPRPIFQHVAESFNCEDIAMSFFVSSLTDGRPPLLAHFWAIETMVKLYSPTKISGTKHHKQLRDDCVESFAQQLNLKDTLYAAPILHRNDTLFYCGDQHYYDISSAAVAATNGENDYDRNNKLPRTTTNLLRGGGSNHRTTEQQQQQETTTSAPPQRQVEHFAKVNQWRRLSSQKEMSRMIAKMKETTLAKAKLAGLIEHTEAWREKFHKEQQGEG